MSNVTTKLVTPTRLRQLLDCYGSSSSSWPEDERQAALSLLKGSPELNTYRDQIQPLDNQLAQIPDLEHNTIDQTAVQSLQQRIMNQLPEQELPDSSDNTHTNKCEVSTHRSYRSRIWIGSIAASLFIVSLSAGFIHQLFNPELDAVNQQSSDIESNGFNNDFARWVWEDITGESLAVDTDNEPTTLLALVELELPAE